MILCVDPDENARARTRETLDGAGLDTAGAASLADGREALRDGDIDCLVTEQDLPDGTGLELIRAARELSPDTACVLFTTRPLDEIDTAAFGDVVAEYVPKNAADAIDELLGIVEHSLAFRSQTAYPVPTDEDARLAALDRYASDPAALSEALDRLVELATAQFETNSAAVGLIDAHEERFISCYGAEFDDMDREKTICTYAILDEAITVIEDVHDDPRFSMNEGLAAADIRFYAGAPIVTPDGRAIGVFCIHDDEPRAFPARDRELLRLFADEAMDQLELRRRLDETGAEPPEVETDG